MESNTVIQRLKEGIARQRHNLTEWLRGTTPEERRIRLGPVSEIELQHHLQTLDTALEKAEENTLGVCTVCHDYVDTSRLEMDYTACVCIEHLTGEERTVLENELELSQKVQRALLPHQVPAIRGLEIAAFSQPAHIVGGDYFDFVRLADGSHAIVIADVMGKGMPASMLMASLQASLKIIAPESKHPSEIVKRLNHLFCHNIQLTKFVTFFIARYEENTGLLTYTNAGHNPPIISRRDGSLEYLMPTGAAIGLVEEAEFSEQNITLNAGESLLLYTDGVVEARNMNREFFGDDRLEVLMRESRNRSSHEVMTLLKNKLKEFSGSTAPSDDTTIIAVRAL